VDERISIRPAEGGDASAIAALWTEAYVNVSGGRGVPYTERDVEESAAIGELMVAEDGSRLAGAVVLHAARTAGARVARDGELEIGRLAVAEAARRRGVARALLAHVREQAVARGCAAVVLWTRPAQQEAHRLYESLGYERVPEREAGDTLVYRLALR
jgi:ribosomal protein S18 acetylase RimI-like enzyme